MILTRRSAQICIVEAAAEYGQRHNIRLTTVVSLNRFCEITKFKPEIGSHVEDFEFAPAPLDAYAARSLRHSLLAMSNLTALTLILPLTTPFSIFTNVHLRKLTLFKTNLPHRVLVRFLHLHRTIRILDIGVCGRSKQCSLSKIDFRRLDELKCPLECAVTLCVPHINTARLPILSHRARAPAATLFQSFYQQLRLHTLTLDIFMDDHNILFALSRAAPGIQNLKLMMQARPFLPAAVTCRPWKNALAWSRDLRLLDILDQLELQTSLPLVSQPGDLAEEEELIKMWLTGKRRPSNYRHHPALRAITLRYRSHTPASTVLSKWELLDNHAEWVRQVSTLV